MVSRSYPDSPIGPARDAFAIVPSDTVPVSQFTKGFRVNGAGTVTFRAIDGSADVTVDAVAGERFDVALLYLKVTGTTATGIIGFA